MYKYEYEGLEIIKPGYKDLSTITEEIKFFPKFDSLCKDLLEEIKNTKEDITLDLEYLALSSAIISSIIIVYRKLKEDNRGLALVNISDFTAEITKCIGLNSMTSVYKILGNLVKGIKEPPN